MVSLERRRKQFYNWWKKNIVEVEVERSENNADDGSFFYDYEGTLSKPTKHKIILNINGDSKGVIERKEQGITSDGQNISHCYALYDTDIKASDYIIWGNVRYRIQSFDTGGILKNDLVFIEFDIVQVTAMING